MTMQIGIVGAGVMGRVLAFNLVKKGFRISLFDRIAENSAENCSMTAAGLLTPITELEKSDMTLATMGTESINTHWPKILSAIICADIFPAARHNGISASSRPG